MLRFTKTFLTLLLSCAATSSAVRAQSPAGPMAPRPGQTVQQAPPGAQLRMRVALVNMPVTARDSKGNMVTSLDPADFRVTDNGVEQKITHFDVGGDPLSVVFLIETSSRIETLLPEVRKTGILFTQTVMGADGEGAVVGFNDGVDKLQDFTKDADAIENTAAHLQTGTDGAKLYDAMSIGVDMLSGRPQPSADKPGRRRVMLVLSEAADSGSETRLGEVLRRAQLANVAIYSVGLSTTRAELGKSRNNRPQPTAPPGINPLPPLPGTIQTPETEAIRNANADLMAAAIWAVQHVNDRVKGNAMDVAATATGGAHLSTYKDRSIETAIAEIGGELHLQYSISYAPSGGSATGYHTIKVQVNRKGLNVRARPGYYVAPPEG